MKKIILVISLFATNSVALSKDIIVEIPGMIYQDNTYDVKFKLENNNTLTLHDYSKKEDTTESPTPIPISTPTPSKADPEIVPNNPHDIITYNYVQSKVGDLIHIANNDYRIIKMPFVEFKSGKAYSIKYPKRVDSNGSLSWFYLSTTHITGSSPYIISLPIRGGLRYLDPERYDYQVIKMPSVVEAQPGKAYSISISPPSENRSMTVDENGKYNYLTTLAIGSVVSVHIGETELNIKYGLSYREDSTSTESSLIESNYDFTDKFDTNKMLHSNNMSLLKAMDELVDYIVVEEL